MPDLKPAPASVAKWIRGHALGLDGVEPGLGRDDLQPLRGIIGDSHVVGLGEATHGTREFFQLKHRMLEFLVAELEFSLFLIEASFPETLDVNRYVMTGDGDPGDVLSGLRFWTWDTEEVLALIEWIRQWNLTHERKVGFYGVDMNAPPEATLRLLDYLAAHDPATWRRVRQPLLPLANDVEHKEWGRRPRHEQEEARAAIAEIVVALNTLSGSLVDAEALNSLAIVRLLAEVLAQGEQSWSALGSGPSRRAWDIRDRAMAQNTAALLALHGPQARAVLWAHNAHVQLQPYSSATGGAGSMGEHLRQRFGSDYRAFGFAFDHGGFQAIDAAGRDGLRNHTVQPAPVGSLDATLAAAGPDMFALDLRNPPPEVRAWFATKPTSRSFGGAYSHDYADVWQPTDGPAMFDAMFFVAETSPARKRPSAVRPGADSAPLAARFVNLDFADVDDGWPDGWRDNMQAPQGSYHAEVADDALTISRYESRWRWGEHTVYQRATADHYRGKRISIRCSIAVQAVHEGSAAHLGVRIAARTPEGDPTMGAVMARILDASRAERVSTREEKPMEVQVEVAVDDQAAAVELALTFTGDGCARFGPVSIDVTDPRETNADA